MIALPRGVCERRHDVGVLRHRVVLQNVHAVGTRSREVENIPQTDPKTAQARSDTAPLGLDGDPMDLAYGTSPGPP